MPNEIDRAIRRLCLAFPEAEELTSHGSPNFRVSGGKIYAIYSVNHHGDGRIALWLNVPDGFQNDYVRADPVHYFVPPYVGPRGWLGVRLDRGLDWQCIMDLTRVAYERVAPARLTRALGPTQDAAAPKYAVTVADIDPKNTPRGRRILSSMRKACLELPATSEGSQFGRTVWRAGKKVFAHAYCEAEQWQVAFWVGVDAQSIVTQDRRCKIPPYWGHNGWISLNVHKGHQESELRQFALASYRHFALKKMLAKL